MSSIISNYWCFISSLKCLEKVKEEKHYELNSNLM